MFLLLLALSALLALGGGVFLLAQFFSLFTSAPFVPSTSDRVRTMIALAELAPGERAVDLGSGDGRLLLEAARAKDVRAEGWEANPLLVLLTRLSARMQGSAKKVSIRWGSYVGRDFRHADVVFLYVLGSEMARLERWLPAALKPGCRVVVNAFPFPNWTPEAKNGTVYRYRVPAEGVGGRV